MENISGNRCIYGLFLACSILVFLSGLINIASGIATCIVIGDFNWYNGGFILLGVILVLSAMFSYKSKFSFTVITIYSISLFVLFLAQLSFTLSLILYDDFDDKLAEKTKADAVRYILLGTCVVIFTSSILSLAYRYSLSKAKKAHRNRFSLKLLDKIQKSNAETKSGLIT